MAFNSRKFQKLIDEEKYNSSFTDDFEDDFDSDYYEELDPAEETTEEPVAKEVDEAPAEEVIEAEPAPEIAEEPVEEPVEEPAPEPEVVVIPEPEPAAEEYDPHKKWQEMAALAASAKESITAGAFFRANTIVNEMRTMLIEMMCRANGINENFIDNADSLPEDCKQDIYSSYVAALSAESLTNAATNIMAVTYKYI